MEQNPPLHLKTLMTLMTNDLRDTSPCVVPIHLGFVKKSSCIPLDFIKIVF